MNVARVRVNDCILAIGGQILTDDAAFTPSLVTVAWRVLQNKLRSSGYTGVSWLKGDVFIAGLPASGASDFAVQNYITWTGFYNGSSTNGTLVLPQNFMEPLDCWERPNAAANSIAVQVFRPMDRTLNGLPTNAPLQSRNINWDWRNGQLLLPGTTVVWDLRVTCLTYLADFPSYGQTPISISAATNASPVVFTSAGNNLVTGATVTVSGGTGNWAAANGTFNVTVVSVGSTFSIPVNSTSFGALTGALAINSGSVVPTTPVPIIDCLSPFANLIAAEFSNARGDLDAKSFYAIADQEISEIYGRDIAQPTAVKKVSEYNSMRGPYTPGQQPAPMPGTPAPQGSNS